MVMEKLNTSTPEEDNRLALERMDNAKCRECGIRNKSHYLMKIEHRFKWPKDWSNK